MSNRNTSIHIDHWHYQEHGPLGIEITFFVHNDQTHLVDRYKQFRNPTESSLYRLMKLVNDNVYSGNLGMIPMSAGSKKHWTYIVYRRKDANNT